MAHYWRGKAGDQALRRSAFQEAIAHLGKAIEMADKESEVVSRVFRTLVWAERHPVLAQAVMAPLICWSFSSSMFRYLLVDHAVPAM